MFRYFNRRATNEDGMGGSHALDHLFVK